MAFISLVRLLVAGFHRFVAKHNLGAHTIFAIAAFIEAQWLLNPAFKAAVLNIYNHTGVWVHVLIPMAATLWVNYRDGSKKDGQAQPRPTDQPQPSTEPAN